MKYSNELKSKILREGIFNDYCQCRKAHFLGDFERAFEFGYKYDEMILNACKSLKDSKNHKKKNLMDRFTPLIWSGKLIFVTLTFKDEVLVKTSEDTRRQYVRKYLKEQCRTYVANIDFGAKNDREHYHALVMPLDKDNKLDLAPFRKYGNINVQHVHATMKDNEKVCKYLSKLSNHALKNTGRVPKLIWSRGLLF